MRWLLALLLLLIVASLAFAIWAGVTHELTAMWLGEPQSPLPFDALD